MNRLAFLCLVLTGAIACATAQLSAQSSTPSPAVTNASKRLGKGDYLETIEALKAAAYTPDGTVRDPVADQLWHQFNPYMTNELAPAVADHGDTDRELGQGWAGEIAAATPRDAITEIVRRARTSQIVILNEAHTSPRDRAFGLEVARALRPLGFSILAVETLRNDLPPDNPDSAVAQLQRDRYVRFNTGAYTCDPVFAGFLRGALALGYEPVAYEGTPAQLTPGGGIAEREQAQASNLVAAIFAKRPEARVLIYVGVSHVAERPLGKIEWMASRLKRMTGIDPLTIDQATITDLSVWTRGPYDLTAHRIGDRSAIFFSAGKPLVLGKYAGAVDLQVIHPARSYRFGRPTWLTTLGGKPLLIPKDLLPLRGRRLIQVFAANAPADAVPLDQVLVEAGGNVPMLMVPAGPVRFQAQP